MTRITRLLLAAFLALASASLAQAQNTTVSLYPASAASLVASSVSSRVALANPVSGGTSIWLANTGTVDAFFKFGDNTVVATTGSAAISAGACLAVSSSGSSFLAAITATGSATLRLIQGPGTPGGSCPSGVNQGGATAANQTTEIGSLATIVTNTGTSAVGIRPSLLTGFGTLSVATSSVALSTLTLGPNSPAYPQPGAALPNGYFTIRNSMNSLSIIYVCWLGGTCSSSVGEPLAIGEAQARNLGSSTVSPTVISGSTATVIANW